MTKTMVIQILEQFYAREQAILEEAEADQSSDLVEHRTEVAAIKTTIDLFKEHVVMQEIAKIL